MKKFLLALVVLYGIWWIFFRQSPAPWPMDGQRFGDVPKQTATEVAPWTSGPYTVRPLARYHLRARVLGKKRYFMGPTSDIAPYDVVFGWGEMSDSAILSHVTIGQSGRWYDYTYDASCPIAQPAIARQSANVHCLPADSTAARDLRRLRVNSFADLRGFLVEVQKEGQSQPWRSSLVRDDEGAGACEVFWITDVTEVP